MKKYLDSKTRGKVWERDKGICQDCKLKLYEEINLTKEGINTVNLCLCKVDILKYKKPCWKCGNLTPIVTYDEFLGGNICIGDVEKIDKILEKEYPFVKKVFSKAQEMEVISNVCIHCGSTQGNHYIGYEDLIDKSKINCVVDSPVETNLKPEDFGLDEDNPYIEEEKIRGLARFYHIDKNKENIKLSNLRLLCRGCYSKRKSE